MAENEKTEKTEETVTPETEPEKQPVEDVKNETPDNVTKDDNGNDFNAEEYINNLQPKAEKPDVKALQSQLDLVTKQRDALKDAYLKLKSTGINLVSNPATEQQNHANPNDVVDEALKKWVHS